MKTFSLVASLVLLLSLGGSTPGSAVTRFKLTFPGCQLPEDASISVTFPEGWKLAAQGAQPGEWRFELDFLKGHRSVDPTTTELAPTAAGGFHITPSTGEYDGSWGAYEFPCKQIVAFEVGSEPPNGLEFLFEVWDGGLAETEPSGRKKTKKTVGNLLRDATVRVLIDQKGCVIADETFYLDELEMKERKKIPLRNMGAECEIGTLKRDSRVIGEGERILEKGLAASSFRYKQLVVRMVENETP